MEKCSNCQGDGIVGAGAAPWLRMGHLSKCVPCGGTGQVGNMPTPAPSNEDGLKETETQDSAPAGSESADKESTPAENVQDSSPAGADTEQLG